VYGSQIEDQGLYIGDPSSVALIAGDYDDAAALLECLDTLSVNLG
jgi:hypothetical protein